MIPYYTSHLLPKHLKHKFFTKHIDSFNKKLIAQEFCISEERLITIKQTHSNTPIIINDKNYKKKFEGDGIITKIPNLALGIFTADCTPILIADSKKNIIAAIHSGWRNAHSGIIQNTIKVMEELGAMCENMIALIGPSISQKNYEVDAEFKSNFNAVPSLFTSKGNKFLFDLPGFNAYQLQKLGIKCHNLNLCTYERASEFFSFRRSTHKNQQHIGRQLSAIMICK